MILNFSKIKSIHLLCLFLLILGFLLGSNDEFYQEGTRKVTTNESQIEKTDKKTYLEIIWDASGSMWGDENETAKINQSKEILDYLNSNLPENIYTGLRIFGARKVGDENDSFLAVTFNKNNYGKIKNYIENIQPLGRSPIALSVEKACKDLQDVSGEKHILLISDGISNDELIEEEVINQLNTNNILFHSIHIGNPEDREIINKLTDITKNTGGKYYSGKNSEETEDVVKTFVNSR